MFIDCIIVDDDEVSTKLLQQCVKRTSYLRLLKCCKNALEAEEFLFHNHVDLIFLDIEMPHMSGIDFMQSLHLKPYVTFTTSKPEYALAAFRLNAVDYLLKPISYPRFLNSVVRVRDRMMQKFSESHTSVFIRTSNNHLRINAEDICYIEKEGAHSRIVTSMYRGDIYSNQSLKEILHNLPAGKFVKVNRSCIVNIDKVSAFTNKNIIVKGTSITFGNSFHEELMKYVTRV